MATGGDGHPLEGNFRQSWWCRGVGIHWLKGGDAEGLSRFVADGTVEIRTKKKEALFRASWDGSCGIS